MDLGSKMVKGMFGGIGSFVLVSLVSVLMEMIFPMMAIVVVVCIVSRCI